MRKIFLITLAAMISASSKSYSQSADTTRKENHNIIFTKAEEPPKFPGGKAGWNMYAKRNLNDTLSKYIKTKQTAIIQFITDKEGYVSDVKLINKNKVNEKFADVAIRIIKNSPAWVPAYQNGRRVSFLNTLKISYPFVEE